MIIFNPLILIEVAYLLLHNNLSYLDLDPNVDNIISILKYSNILYYNKFELC